LADRACDRSLKFVSVSALTGKKRFRRKEKNNEIVENYVVKIHHFLFLHPSLNILTAKTYILEGETLPNFHDSFSQFVFSVL